MQRIKNIDIQESIKNEELIFEMNLGQKLDRLFSILVFICGIYLSVSIFLNENEPIETFFKFVIIIAVLLLCYCIYRKFIEFNLSSITTNLNKKDNTNLLLEYLKSKNHDELIKSKEIIVLSKNGYFLTQNIETFFIVSDNKIFFTILKEGYRLDLPCLFSHIKLRKELNIYFNKNNKS